MKREDRAGLTRRDALKLAAGAALSVPVLFTRAMAAPAVVGRGSRGSGLGLM